MPWQRIVMTDCSPLRIAWMALLTLTGWEYAQSHPALQGPSRWELQWIVVIQADHTHGVHFVLCEGVMVSTENLDELGWVAPLEHVAALYCAVTVPVIGVQLHKDVVDLVLNLCVALADVPTKNVHGVLHGECTDGLVPALCFPDISWDHCQNPILLIHHWVKFRCCERKDSQVVRGSGH